LLDRQLGGPSALENFVDECKSAEKYVGDDALDLLVLLPTLAQL
jgi:hypothetical protein